MGHRLYTYSVRSAVCAIAIGSLVGSAVASGAATRASAIEQRAVQLGFDAKDAAALFRGGAAARAIEPADDAELSAMGAVVVPATIDEVLGSFGDLSLLVESGMVVEAKRFASEPTLADLEALRVPEQDAKDLVKAKVADSEVKLSEPEITSVAGRVPPTHIDLYKRALLDRVVAFKNGGVEGLGTYADKKRRVDQSEVSRALLARLSATRPAEHFQLADEFQYWSVVRFGDFKPLVELNHVSVFRGDRSARIETVQIYASHYCDALVTGIDLFELPGQQGVATLMRLTFSARVDSLGGMFGGIKRSVGRSKLVGNLTTGLERVRDTIGDTAVARRD
jgi:hypothetical protein